MAYQNVKTPRIYLNIPEYLASTGVEIDPILRTLPVSKTNSLSFITNNPRTQQLNTNITDDFISDNNYVAVLNHSLEDINFEINSDDNYISGTEIVNPLDGSSLKGFSVMDFSSNIVKNVWFNRGEAPFTDPQSIDIGSIMCGFYYDFPHSPDLNLTLTYSYGGVKEITTRGGSTLTNSFYTKPPYSFEIGDVETQLAKSGRRIWDLSFSFLSSEKVFPDNAGLSNENPDSTNLTLLQDNTLQRAIHLTNGGQIPFLFQSDNSITENFQNQLAICKFDMNSFKFSQVAPNMYSISIRIREVW